MISMIEGFLRFIKCRKIKIDIITVFIALLTVTVSFIVVYSYNQSVKAVLKLSKELMAQISSDVIHQTTDMFAQARALSLTGASLTRSPTEINLDNQDLCSYLLSIPRYVPFIDNAYIATANGSMLESVHLRRSFYFSDPSKPLPIGSKFALRFINLNNNPATELWIYKDNEGKTVGEETIPPIVDPRERPWFIEASNAKKIIWTDVYIFNEAPLPGITAACPIYDQNGQFIAVIGVDIFLKGISSFLEKKISFKDERILMVNEKEEILASSFSLEGVSNTTRLSSIGQLKDKTFAQAFALYKLSNEKLFFFSEGGINYISFFFPIDIDAGQTWVLSVVIPKETLIHDVNVIIIKVLVFSFVIFVGALLMVLFLAGKISRPIVALTHEIDKVKAFDLKDPIIPKSHIKEIAMIEASLADMKQALQSFSLFIPKLLVKQLVEKREGIKLGGELRVVTISFYDIAHFTTISEHFPPQELMLQVSEYLRALSPIIIQNQGTIDKYIGDNIMSFWNAPSDDPDHILHSCMAAWACQQKVAALNQKWKKEKKPCFETRMGIHTGDVIVGNIGSSERMNYTVVGSSVNIASRLEGANKIYQTKIIISEPIAEKVKDHFIIRLLDLIALKGSNTGIFIYELRALKKDPEASSIETFCNSFTEGVQLYLNRRWQEALTIFQKLSLDHPKDGALQFYIGRIQELLTLPEDAQWDPVFKPLSK